MFLPDWINLFEFINFSTENEIADDEKFLDCNTTMSVLSTIDTVDLHRLITAKNNSAEEDQFVRVPKHEYDELKKIAAGKDKGSKGGTRK